MTAWKNILIVVLAACMAGCAGSGGSGSPPNPNVTGHCLGCLRTPERRRRSHIYRYGKRHL